MACWHSTAGFHLHTIEFLAAESFPNRAGTLTCRLVAAHHHTRQLQLKLRSSITQLVDQGYSLPGLLLVCSVVKALSRGYSLKHAVLEARVPAVASAKLGSRGRCSAA